MRILVLACMLLVGVLAGCGASIDTSRIANPASVYCEEQGGILEVRSEPAGQVGYCVFDDGSECEEWAFYREECQPGQVFGGGTGE